MNAFHSVNQMAQLKRWPSDSIQNSVPSQPKYCCHAGVHALQGHCLALLMELIISNTVML